MSEIKLNMFKNYLPFIYINEQGEISTNHCSIGDEKLVILSTFGFENDKTKFINNFFDYLSKVVIKTSEIKVNSSLKNIQKTCN